jgi:ribosomal protein S18 acetylase RimI-like enzyme
MAPEVIRECTIRDFNDIFLLLQQIWPNKELHSDALKKIFKQKLDSEASTYFCTESDGKVIGFCSVEVNSCFWREGLVGYINELVVDKQWRRQGIGTELLQNAFNYAKTRGCKSVELDSAFYRKEAHELYLKLGFEKRAYLFYKEL